MTPLTEAAKRARIHAAAQDLRAALERMTPYLLAAILKARGP